MAGDAPRDDGAPPAPAFLRTTDTFGARTRGRPRRWPMWPAAWAIPSHKGGFWALTIGAIGVVFGDIGTSPLYALREAIAHAQSKASAATWP